MKKVSNYFLILLLATTYCSTNQKIIVDNRYKITKAPKWKDEYVSADSGSGLIIQLNKDKNALLPHKIELSFWNYPLDTIITEEEFYNVRQPMPRGSFADEKIIDYKINNHPILIPIKVDSTNRFYISLQPDTFYLSINSFHVAPNYLKDIIVKK